MEFLLLLSLLCFSSIAKTYIIVCVLVSRHKTQLGRIGYQNRNKLYADILCVFRADFINVPSSFVCLILFFTFHQQSFNYIGTGLPGLNLS